MAHFFMMISNIKKVFCTEKFFVALSDKFEAVPPFFHAFFFRSKNPLYFSLKAYRSSLQYDSLNLGVAKVVVSI